MTSEYVLSSNPFELLELRLLGSIEKIIEKKISSLFIPPATSTDDLVEFDIACKILHLKPDQLYGIHKRFFNTKKPGRKLLFVRGELDLYLDGKLKAKRNKGTSKNCIKKAA